MTQEAIKSLQRAITAPAPDMQYIGRMVELLTSEHAALCEVAEAAVHKVSVHPGTDKRGHDAYDCLLCGQRGLTRDAVQHLPCCALAKARRAAQANLTTVNQNQLQQVK